MSKTNLARDNKTPANVEADQIGATTHRIKSIRANDAPYLRPDEAAQLLQISRRCLSNWQRRHLIPFFRVPGRTVLFRRTDIEAALERFRISAVGE